MRAGTAADGDQAADVPRGAGQVVTRRAFLLALLPQLSHWGEHPLRPEGDRFTVRGKVSFDRHEVEGGVAYIAWMFGDGTGITIFGDTDLPFVQWCERNNGKQLRGELIAA